jgi:hypothetical protein
VTEFKKGLDDLKKYIKSQKTTFEAGNNGLQAMRARAIQSYPHLIVQKGHKKVEVSEMSALTSGFAATTGGRLIRLWTKDWMIHCELPMSDRDWYVKVKSHLKDPLTLLLMPKYGLTCVHTNGQQIQQNSPTSHSNSFSQLKQKNMPSASLIKKCLAGSRNILRLSCSRGFK